MPALNLYDYSRFCETPVLRTVHVCAQKALPELGMLPNVLINGTSYKTPILISEADGPIFAKIAEGVCGAKSDYDMVKNETFGIDFKVESILRAENASCPEQEEILANDLFTQETENRYRRAFERIVKQFYQGTNFELHGFPGLPSAVNYKINALDPEWNQNKNFTPDVAGKEDCLYSVYLIYAAEAATETAPGMKWIWGNRQTIRPTGPRRVVDLVDPDKNDPNCTFEGWRQHHNGSVGLGYTCNVDVIEIANVPSWVLPGFYLENVISQAGLLFPGNRKYNRVLIHKLAHNAMWSNVQNQNQGNRQSPIVAPTSDGGFGMKMPDFFDGTENIQMIISECMPPTGLQTIAAQTQKDLNDEIMDHAA